MISEKDNTEPIKRFTSKGVFPHQFAFTLLIPLRNIFLSPEKLIKRLELKEDHTVLEIGPGPGYFSLNVARNLPEGKLVLTDIQEEMLNYAKKRLDKKGIRNVEYKLCDGQKLDFSDESFDRVFMVTVIGEVEHKEAYIKEIYRILKKGGMLSISELAGDPDKMSIGEIEELVGICNFRLKNRFGNSKNYTVNFEKLY
jgi:ubiquinone/menaquinone biosynthesis C-methylase UbiE